MISKYQTPVIVNLRSIPKIVVTVKNYYFLWKILRLSDVVRIRRSVKYGNIDYIKNEQQFKYDELWEYE